PRRDTWLAAGKSPRVALLNLLVARAVSSPSKVRLIGIGRSATPNAASGAVGVGRPRTTRRPDPRQKSITHYYGAISRAPIPLSPFSKTGRGSEVKPRVTRSNKGHAKMMKRVALLSAAAAATATASEHDSTIAIGSTVVETEDAEAPGGIETERDLAWWGPPPPHRYYYRWGGPPPPPGWGRPGGKGGKSGYYGWGRPPPPPPHNGWGGRPPRPAGPRRRTAATT
ncbi:hypothetical protein THAOC_28161, partial [Thalassiosira oceanica]